MRSVRVQPEAQNLSTLFTNFSSFTFVIFLLNPIQSLLGHPLVVGIGMKIVYSARFARFFAFETMRREMHSLYLT